MHFLLSEIQNPDFMYLIFIKQNVLVEKLKK